MSSDDNSFGFDGGVTPSPSDAPGTGVGVIAVAKRDYAVGLHWNGVEQPTKAATEARELASSSSFNADYYCVRQGATPQFGLGFRSQGHKAGMPSLAAHVALARSGSWIGLFEVAGGFYLIAVRDDGILSECDRFFSDPDEARNTFEDFQGQSEWSEAIAPADFDIPGTTPGSIESLLEGRPQVRLHEVRRSSNIIRLGLALLAVGGIVIGGMLYLDHLEALRIQAEQLAIDAKNAVSPEPEKIEIPPMPWEGMKMGVPVLDACVAGILKFPTDIPRWDVKEFFCQNGSAAAAIDRVGQLGSGGGSINWISVQIKGFNPAASVIPPAEGSGGRVSVQWPLPETPTIPVDLKTAPVAKMRAAMLAQFEERMTPVLFSESDANEFWRGFIFRFTTKEDPRSFDNVIGALPGVIMNSVRYSVDSHEWTLEGKAYEQLPLPQKPRQ